MIKKSRSSISVLFFSLFVFSSMPALEQKSKDSNVKKYLDALESSLEVVQKAVIACRSLSIKVPDKVPDLGKDLRSAQSVLFGLVRRLESESPEKYMKTYVELFKENFRFVPGITKGNVLERLKDFALKVKDQDLANKLSHKTIRTCDLKKAKRLIDEAKAEGGKENGTYYRQLGYFFADEFSRKEFMAYLRGELEQMHGEFSAAERQEMLKRVLSLNNKIDEIKIEIVNQENFLKHLDKKIKDDWETL